MQSLKRSGCKIIDASGNEIQLKGINLGGWLMMEGYILGGHNVTESEFLDRFREKNGEEETGNFISLFRDTFITEEDFKNIASMGFNCIRLPFHYKVCYEGIKYIDMAVELCAKYGLYLILDMHAAPGSQNHDWHSDTNGKPELWSSEENREKFISLWEKIAGRYIGKDQIAAYNLVNEPVLYDKDAGDKINSLYRESIRRIRSIDSSRMIMLEGNIWSTDLSVLEDFSDPNIFFSAHFYNPVDFTFNLRPGEIYPGILSGEYWDRDKLLKCMERYVSFRTERNAPILIGEFGVNYRNGCSGELKWIEDCLDVFEQLSFHWTYWTYKTIPMHMFPDGLYRYVDNDIFISRHMNKHGFETWPDLWKDNKKDIINALKTNRFVFNENVAEIIKETLNL